MNIDLGNAQELNIPAAHTKKFKIIERSDGALFITAKSNNNKGVYISTVGQNEILVDSKN